MKFSLDDRVKLEGTEGKRVVKKAMEPLLPRDVLYRSKHGFNVPMRIWLRQELRDLVHDLLSPARIRSRGLIRPQAVANLIAAHAEGRHDFANRIFVLMCLELWFQAYVDDRSRFTHG